MYQTINLKLELQFCRTFSARVAFIFAAFRCKLDVVMATWLTKPGGNSKLIYTKKRRKHREKRRAFGLCKSYRRRLMVTL